MATCSLPTAAPLVSRTPAAILRAVPGLGTAGTVWNGRRALEAPRATDHTRWRCHVTPRPKEWVADRCLGPPPIQGLLRTMSPAPPRTGLQSAPWASSLGLARAAGTIREEWRPERIEPAGSFQHLL